MSAFTDGWGGGYVAAAPTPFTRDGRLDEERLRAVVAHFVAQGAAGVSVNGTAGEWFLQSEEERVRVASAAREAVPPQVPFLVGLSAQSLDLAVRLAEHARDLGAAAGLLGLPLGRVWCPAEVRRYYGEFARRSSLPVIVYSLRQADGNFLDPHLLSELGRIEGVVGVKDDSPDLDRRRGLLHGDHGLLVFADLLHPEILGRVPDARGGQIGAGMPLGRPLADALRQPARPESRRTAEALALVKRQMVALRGPGQPWHADLKGLLLAEGVDAGYPRFPGTSGRDDPELLRRYRQILDQARRMMLDG